MSERIVRTTSRYFIGVDLGKERDYSAIAILEQATHTFQDRDPVRFAFRTRTELALRHAERIPLGTPYPEVNFRISNVVRQGCLNGPLTLVLDATGLGTPVVDHLRREKLNCKLDPVVITAQVRRNLLANLIFLFEGDKLKIAHDMHMLDAVIDELNGLSHEGRSAAHDDLAFALALAAWPIRDRIPGGHQPHPLPIYGADRRKCA